MSILNNHDFAHMIANSRFPRSTTRPSVFVAHGDCPYTNARQAIASVDLTPASGRRVLLKPNVGRIASVGSGITTHPEVIAAAIDAFREAGAEVAIGESPILGVKVREAFATSGVASIADARNCPLIDMDRRPAVTMPVPEGRVLHRLMVCPEVLEFDFVVSIPVMKMHMHTKATLAVKNMKGCLWRRSKVALHMLPPLEGSDDKPIDVAIADMSSVLRPHLALIDGTVGLEGMGPSAGRAKALGVVVASADAFAADATACQLMGMVATSVPHLRFGAERGYGVIDLDRMTVTPENWRDWVSPFCPPPENLTIEFPNVTVWDRSSCSACQSTLLLFLMHHRDRLFDYFGSQNPVNVAIGKGHADLPEGTLCLGNCTANHNDKGVFVRGCPPVGSQILTTLSDQSSGDALSDNIEPEDD